MKKILFICSRMPYPPIGGDRAKNYHLLIRLKSHFDITVVALTTEPPSPEAVNFLNDIGENYIVKISKFRFFLNLVKSVFQLPRPIQSSLYYCPSADKIIKKLSCEVDVVFCNLIRTTQYVEESICPKVCDMADSIGQNYKLACKKTSSKLLSIYYRIESNLLIRYERDVVRVFDRVFLFNKNEISQFPDVENITWIPHGVNEELLKFRRNSKFDGKSIGFFGKMDYQPNIDAVLWFVKNIFPFLSSDIKFYIVGANPTGEIRSLQNERIFVTGFVENPYEILIKFNAMVAPLVSGGGIQNKVLEAMAIGQVNIISPLAAAPMHGLVDGVHAFIATSNMDWINYIEMATSQAAILDCIGENARKYIEENYTWGVASMLYAAEISSVIAKKRHSS